MNDLAQGELTELLWSSDCKKEEVRTDADFVHVSTLIKWCAREYALSLRYLKLGARETQPSGSDRIVWTIGRAVEKHIRDSIISSWGASNVFGRWFCRCGATHSIGVFNNRHLSECCGSLYSNYGEYLIKNWEYRIKGSVDLILVVGKDRKLAPFEIKSITDGESANKQRKGFSTLKQPLGDHALQLAMYSVCLRDEGLPYDIADYGGVIYGRKEYKFFTPYKDFMLDMSVGSTWYKLGSNIRATAAPVFNPNVLPARLCANAGCTRAKGCEWVQSCFSQE